MEKPFYSAATLVGECSACGAAVTPTSWQTHVEKCPIITGMDNRIDALEARLADAEAKLKNIGGALTG